MKDFDLSSNQLDLIVYSYEQQTGLPGTGRDVGALLGERFGFRCPAFALTK
jgi:hypothetical protein